MKLVQVGNAGFLIGGIDNVVEMLFAIINLFLAAMEPANAKNR